MRSASPDSSTMRRLAIGAAALVPRLILGAISFGAEDGVASLRNSLAIFQGGWADTPYFPFIEVWIWTAGIIAYYTAIPVMLPYKLLPIAADALIALLLFDSATDPRKGTRNALLYALSPIAIWFSAVHMQWDSLWMYFLLLALVLLRLEGAKAAAIAGACLVLSVAAKPIALPLAVILLPLVRRRALAFIGGGAAMAAIYTAFLASIGWLLTVDNLLFIFRYARKGVQLFGLPHHPFNRLWTSLAILGALWLLCILKKVTREEAVFLFFCALMGVAGLSPQYLWWLVPFAIVAGRLRFLALYTLLAGLFLALYYRVPFLNGVNVENLGAYGYLHSLSALSPPAAPPMCSVIARFLGNYAIPLFCLGYVIFEVLRILRKDEPHHEQPAPRIPFRYAVPLLIVVLGVTLSALWAGRKPEIEPRAYIYRIEQKIEGQYDVVRYRRPLPPGRGKVWVPRSTLEPARAALHAGILAPVFVIAAAAFTFPWRKDP